MSFDRIIFEYPTGWLEHGADPLSEQHTHCFNTIKRAAGQLGLTVSTEVSLRMADFAPRVAPDNALLISTHTVGVAKNVVRLKESYLPGYYYFDRTGYSGWAEIAYNQKLQTRALNDSSAATSDFLKKLRDDKLRNNTSKYCQHPAGAAGGMRAKKPYIFLALQTTDDLVSRLASIDQLRLAHLLAEKTQEQGLQLLIKRHPLCHDTSIENGINQLICQYRCVHLTNESVNVLIADAMAVATVNSGVGFEALVMGTPVISASRSDYSCVTSQLLSENDCTELDFSKIKRDDVQVENFVHYYLNKYCLNYLDTEAAKDMINKWSDNTYSSMNDILSLSGNPLEDSRSYTAELEMMRRHSVLNRSEYSAAELTRKTMPDRMKYISKFTTAWERIFG